MRGSIVLILASIFALSAGQRTATVECYDEGDSYQMIFTVTPNGDADLNYVYAINLTSPDFDPALVEQCGSNQTNFYSFNVGGNSEFQINITVDKLTLGVDKDCGHTEDGLTFEWMFRTTKVEYLIQRSIDIQYRAICNFSEATKTEITAGPFIVTGDVVEAATVPGTNIFTLELVDAASYVALSSVSLGQNVRLLITHTQGGATGVSGFSCRAGNNLIFDRQLDLLDIDGCPSPIGLVASGFVPYVVGLPGSALKAATGIFEQFQFTGFATVVYSCTVHYCVYDNNVPCDDLCANGGPSGRKKRQAVEELQDEQEITATIRINMYPVPPSSLKPGTTDGEERTKEVPSCLSNVGIIAAFAVLGALLLVTIAVAVFVCVRSMRLTSDSHKSEKPKL